jgi:large subunit ribosomal protein L25
VAEYTLNVEARSATGKGVARKLRAAGRIPGVCYGSSDPQSISLDPNALDALIRSSASGMNTLIDLKVDGGGTFDGKKVLVKEVQRDPITSNALHADFFALDMTTKLDVAVPVHVSGIPVGVSMMGGILDHVLREIHLECLPHSIPDEIVIDVSELEIGMSIHVHELPLPAGVELRTDGDLSVVSVAAPKAIEEEVPTEEEELEGEAAEAAEGEAAPSAADAEKSGEKSED